MKTKPIDFTDYHFRRFWKHVDKSSGIVGCWPYTGFVDRFGYGRFTLGSSNAFVSNRVAYAAVYGDPQGLEVCHLCHNPICCNPNHLYAGNHLQNMLDKIDRKRAKGVQCYYGVMARVYDTCTRYTAKIFVDGKQRHIGTFATAEEAAMAWDRKAVEVYSNWTRLNFPQVPN